MTAPSTQRIQPNGHRLYGYQFPYHQPLKWNDNLPEAGGTYLLLRLRTTDGLVGVAEATVKPTWSGTSVRSLIASVEDVLLPRLAGVNLLDECAVTNAVADIPENRTAKTLVDNACWDLRSQASGQPLWQLLGGCQAVPVSWTLTRAAPEKMAEEALAMMGAHGFETFKMKGGQGLGTDVSALRAVRRAVGEQVKVYVDANWQYAVEEGISFAKAMAAEGACLIEDPWRLAPDPAFLRATSLVPAPILVDYFCSGPGEVASFTDSGATAFSVKPGRIGLTESRQMARICAERNARVVVGQFAETMVGSVTTLSFAATRSDRFPAESSFFLAFRDAPLKNPLLVRNGCVELPAVAGIERLLDWDQIERHSSQ